MRRDLVPDEIRVVAAYETVRGDERGHLARGQRERRVRLTSVLSLVFETRETLRAALEEMLRTERTADPERIADGVAAFNALLPEGTGLGATLYVDVADPAELAQTTADLGGVEKCVYLEVGTSRSTGTPDATEAEDEPAGAWHVRFALDGAQAAAWRGGAEVAVGVEHAACSARVVLGEEQRRAIGADL